MHGFLHNLNLLVSLLLLSIFIEMPYVPAIPSALLIFYTAIRRPYKQFKENIRSIFNLIVMCSVIGFNAYLKYVDKSNLNTMTTYLFLMGVQALILIAIVISLASTIAYWYYYKYIRPDELNALFSDQEKQNNRLKHRILWDLSKRDVKVKMKKISQMSVFKNILDPQQNLLDFSNLMR